MNRRRVLKIAGSAGVIVAAGGGAFALTRTPSKALEPWADAGGRYADPMRWALSHAILAPNPHNRQPWLVELKGERDAVLRCDLGRLLPATDPYNRQIVIGLGCFLEAFSIATLERGLRAWIETFPDGAAEDALDGRPVARLRLVEDAAAAPDPLFADLTRRRTNRNPHDLGRPVAGGVLGRLRAAAPGVRVGTAADGPLLTDLRVLTRDAMSVEFETPRVHAESVGLMRFGRAEIEANPDGISLGGAVLETMNLLGIMTRERMADPASTAFRMGRKMFEEAAMSSTAFLWLATAGDGRHAQIEAGRAYMRVALQATAEGLAMQPMSQALQEYPEMAPYLARVQGALAEAPGERVQMLARLGYANDVDPAPRWPRDTRLKQG